MKKVKVIFSPEAEYIYKYLNKEAPTSKNERMILNAVNNKIELNKHFELDIACEESKTRGGGNFPNYGTEIINPIGSCI